MRTACIFIDSTYRNSETFPSPSSYVYHLDDVMSNVRSIELVEALYERVTTDKYVNLKVDELVYSPSDISSNSQIALRSFAHLPLIAGPVCAFQKSSSGGMRYVHHFDPPLAKLHRLTISWLRQDGSLYPPKNHVLRFHIQYEKSISPIPAMPTKEHVLFLKSHDRAKYEELKKQIRMISRKNMK